MAVQLRTAVLVTTVTGYTRRRCSAQELREAETVTSADEKLEHVPRTESLLLVRVPLRPLEHNRCRGLGGRRPGAGRG
jgi:hypothetical protein